MLYRRYVESILAERPGLRNSVRQVLGHLLKDPSRTDAFLDDAEAGPIRQAWAAGLTPEEARMMLSPLEALAHEGILTKRVGQTKSGYGFIYQRVAEYLIYLHLADERGGAPEVDYWSQLPRPEKVFPEYAGAFGFLLRDWSSRGCLEQASQLIESSGPWLGNELVVLLWEQAAVGHVPGKENASADAAASALAKNGSEKTGTALLEAGKVLLADLRFPLAAKTYFRDRGPPARSPRGKCQ